MGAQGSRRGSIPELHVEQLGQFQVVGYFDHDDLSNSSRCVVKADTDVLHATTQRAQAPGLLARP